MNTPWNIGLWPTVNAKNSPLAGRISEEMARAISDTTARPPRSADFRHWPRTYDSSFGETSIRGGRRVSCQEARSVGVKSDTCVLHVLCLSSQLTRISSYFTHFTQLWITSSLRDTDFSKGPNLMYGKVRLLSYASQALSSNFFRRSAIGTRLRIAVSFVFPAPSPLSDIRRGTPKALTSLPGSC